MGQLRLTFHIGMPKTATTTLQRHVFPAFPGYVGKGYGPVGQELHSELDFNVQAARRALGSTKWREELADWVEELHDSGLNDVIFSDEALCAWSDGQLLARWPMADAWIAASRVRPHPVVEFLKLARELVGDATDVRAILIVRNQSDLMGSLYAQMQPFVASPSQADFEGKIAGLLAAGDPFFDFGTLVEELDAALKPSNCLILLHEDGVEHNAHRIADFLGLSCDVIRKSIPAENVKASGEGAWQYRASMPLLKRGLVGRIRKAAQLRITRLGGGQRGLRRVLRRLDQLSLTVFPPRVVRGVQIVLPAMLAGEIRTHFAESNARLAERLQRNLTSLGY